MAAPTVLKSGNFINVSNLTEDCDAWTITTRREPDVVKFKRIEFIGGANADILVIKQDGAGGPEICRLGTPDAVEPDRVYFENGQYLTPFIDFGDCTLNAGHMVIFELE